MCGNFTHFTFRLSARFALKLQLLLKKICFACTRVLDKYPVVRFVTDHFYNVFIICAIGSGNASPTAAALQRPDATQNVYTNFRYSCACKGDI